MDSLAPDKMIGDITLTDLEKFTEWLQNERGVPCSPKSLSRRITSVKSFFRWLQNSGVILVDPADKLVQRSVTSPLPQVMSREEVEAALAAAAAMREADEPDARPYTPVTTALRNSDQERRVPGN